MTWFIVWSSLLFAVGLLFGAGWGIGHGEKNAARDLEEERAEERRVRWLERLRETRGGTVMPYRSPTDLPCGCPSGMRYHAMNCPEFPDQLQLPAGVASGWLAGYNAIHQGTTVVDPPLIVQEDAASLDFWRSLDQPNYCPDDVPGCNIKHARPETDEEFTARLAGWADEIIAAARLTPDPYDQLWSAQ